MVCLLPLNNNVYGQGSESIGSDRPGQAISPLVVGKGIFQLQTGFTLSDQTTDNSDMETNSFQYIINPRVGITRRLELNTMVAFRNDNIESMGGENTLSGLSTLNFGARYTFLEGEDFSPSLGLQFDVSLTSVSDDFKPNEASPRIILTHSQNLLDWLSLTTNFGIVWDGNSDDAIGIYILNLSFPISDKVGAFVEAYANSANGDFDINYDTGLGYLVNNNLQLDISTGYGKNDGVRDWFVDAGVSWRFNYSGN